MKICDDPTIACPMNVTIKRSGEAEAHLTIAPRQLPNDPSKATNRSPYLSKTKLAGKISGIYCNPSDNCRRQLPF